MGWQSSPLEKGFQVWKIEGNVVHIRHIRTEDKEESRKQIVEFLNEKY